MNFVSKSKAALAAATVAATLLSAPAQALVLANGNYVQYDFDLSGLVDTSGPARGLLITQWYRGDILSGRDKILLEVFDANANPLFPTPVSWTTVTEWTFGPTSAWGFQMYARTGTSTWPIMESFKGSYRITALQGSVNLVEATATVRDVAFNDVTQVQFREELPEPSTPSLLLAGLAACAWLGRQVRSGTDRHRQAAGLTA